MQSPFMHDTTIAKSVALQIWQLNSSTHWRRCQKRCRNTNRS